MERGAAGDVVMADAAFLAAAAARLRAAAATTPGRRYLLGLAGIPGAGKSTLAARLVECLNAGAPVGAGPAALVPLDGFHLSNRDLAARGLRERKGAPETFDVPAYLALLRAVRRLQPADAIPFPIYDRTVHEPVWRDALESRLTARQTLIITEGNYLLLDQPPWTELADLLDECWLVETPVAVARQRLLARHQRGGRSPADALAHYQRCDLPNTLLVREHSRPPTWRVSEGLPPEPEEASRG